MDLAIFLIKFEVALLVAMGAVVAFRVFAPVEWRRWLTSIVHHRRLHS
jgi:hypothetical protein